MLSKIAKSLAKSTIMSCRVFAPKVSMYQFSNNTLPEKVTKLKNILGDQINYQQDNKPNINEQLEYFKNANWSISHNGTQVMLSKSNDPYQLRVLFNARTPPSESEESQQQNQQDDQENEDYCQVSAYVSKDGKKWLCAEFMILNNECHMSMVNFINNFELERTERQANRSAQRYNGPELSSLQATVLDSVTEFLEAVGIDNNLLTQSADYATSYEHKFYLEWLKNLDSIC